VPLLLLVLMAPLRYLGLLDDAAAAAADDDDDDDDDDDAGVNDVGWSCRLLLERGGGLAEEPSSPRVWAALFPHEKWWDADDAAAAGRLEYASESASPSPPSLSESSSSRSITSAPSGMAMADDGFRSSSLLLLLLLPSSSPPPPRGLRRLPLLPPRFIVVACGPQSILS